MKIAVLGARKMEKDFQTFLSKKDIVSINLNDETITPISGFVVKVSKDFILLNETYDFFLYGFKIISKEDIQGYKQNKSEKTIKKIFENENLIYFDHNIIENTKIEDFESIFNSIKQQDLHCIVESIKKDNYIFSIGEILDVTKDYVVIKNYDGSGKIRKNPDKIKYKNIKVITFNDNYSKTFRKYLTE